MNNFTIANNDKDSIIVANLQEKVKDYARHAFAKNTIKKRMLIKTVSRDKLK